MRPTSPWRAARSTRGASFVDGRVGRARRERRRGSLPLRRASSRRGVAGSESAFSMVAPFDKRKEAAVS
jgi:hypothetical protein